MKNTKLFVAMAMLSIAFLTPQVSKAQVATPEPSVAYEELRQTLIQLLLQQIAILQAQIDEIIAKKTGTYKPVEEVIFDFETPTNIGSVGTTTATSTCKTKFTYPKGTKFKSGSKLAECAHIED